MHRTVLLQEVVDALQVKSGDVFLDCTVGSGGHSCAVAKTAGGPITLIGIDEDESALERARKNFSSSKIKAVLYRENFRNLDLVLSQNETRKTDAILFDLGVSTEELLDSERGFSFQKDEPLIMTFNKKAGLTAHDVVNKWSEENLKHIIRGFGGERYAEKIAEAIVKARAVSEITTSKQLANIISKAIKRRGKIHPATKTFQAIRIAVNDEFGALKEGLQKAVSVLKDGGRCAVISFHSGEDKIVKQFFKESEKIGMGITSKKPIVPSSKEVFENPRARSAKMRVFIKNIK
jgi:16S rRNA (cytosine1402-N4)-methyltransferase